MAFCPFSFGHCVVCPSIYGSWLLLWYLQTLLYMRHEIPALIMRSICSHSRFVWMFVLFQACVLLCCFTLCLCTVFFFIHLFLYSDPSFLANSFGLEFTSFDVLILEIFPWYNVNGTFLFHNVLHTNWWRWQWSWPWFSYSWLLRNCTSLW